MYCEICGSNSHDSTTAGCPLGREARYFPQDRVMEEFTNPNAPTAERQIIDLLREIKTELVAIKLSLEHLWNPPL